MNFKRLIISFLLIFTISSLFCACQPSADSTELSADAELPVLRIGVDTLQPFFYIDENGNYAGIDAEIATEACRRAGYRPEFVKISWNNRDDYLERGAVDCLWSAFIKNGREDSYLWTDTYLQSNLRAIVDTKSPDQNISSLAGKAGIAVRSGSKIEDILLNNSSDHAPIHIYSCGTFDMAESAFIKGYIGALGGHEAVLQEILNEYPGSYRFLDGSIMTADLGVAFYKEDTSEHCQKINDELQSMLEDGSIRTISEKYLSNTSAEKEASENAQN